MKVAVTGATGTIGRALVRELAARGDAVTALSRDAERAARALGADAGEAGAAGADAGGASATEAGAAEAGASGAGATEAGGAAGAGSVETASWPAPKGEPPPLDALRGRDGVVHLLGEPIAQRWTDEAKQEILDSRVLATRNLVAALAELPSAERPRVLVSQSAVGWYGARGPEPLDESAPAGDDFQARVVAAWEAEARKAEELEGLRVVRVRTGVVLSPEGGALEKMLPFFKLGIGGPVAGGKQYLPWVHLDDVVGALVFCLDTDAATGAVNVTAPQPVTNAAFSKALGRALKRPALLPVPAFAIKTLYGQMAEIVTAGANVQPQQLQALGYAFRQAELEPALRSTINAERGS